MIPSFAVVGRSNKGKSSIVATLTENDQIRIAPTPRTTEHCERFTLKADGEALIEIIDTPGFEQAAAVLEWLQEKPISAHQRPQRIREFLNHFAGGNEFPFEQELLRPIMAGAAILYVADASKPYRPHYESEFEILRWTGQPSMALINQIGDGDYAEDWQAALKQYFDKVKRFNAHKSRFRDRIALLDELRVLHDDAQKAIQNAIHQLTSQQDQRLRRSAAIFSAFIADAIRFQIREKISESYEDAELRQRLSNRYQTKLNELEKSARQSVLKLFHYHPSLLAASEHPQDFELDLFSGKTWDIFGLNRQQIMIAGVAAGAIAGGGIDAMVGGTSILIGSGVGALLGGGSSAYLAFAKPKIAGIHVSRSFYTIGPSRNPNFAFVLLDRSLSFMQAVLQRTHAQRQPMQVTSAVSKRGLSAQLSHREIRTLSKLFRKLRSSLGFPGARDELQKQLEDYMRDIDQQS